MQEANYINSAINSNRQMFQTMSNNYAATPKTQYYSSIPTQYYNDEVIIKKENKKKRNKALIITACAMAGVSAAFATIRYGRKIPWDKYILPTANTLKEKVQNGCANFTTVKDALWRKVENRIENVPVLNGIKKGSDALSNFYYKFFKDGIDGKINKIFGGNKEAAQQFIEEVFGQGETLDSVYAKLQDRLAKGEVIDDIIGDDKSIKNLANKLTAKGLRDEAINNTKGLNFKEISDNIDKFFNKIDVENVPNMTNAQKKILAANLEHQKASLKHILLGEFLPKAGDIANGCAPTDVITAGIPAIALGVAVGTEDNKQKKKSLIFNLGFPLVPTCLMPLVGLRVPTLNGFKGMLAGFIVGQAAKSIVVLVNKIIKKDNSDTHEL